MAKIKGSNMGIGSIAFIDFLANFNYTSADFAHQWVLNDGIREKSLGWKNKINNNKELTVGINFNNAEPLNTQLGITNQQVYDEINAAINLWQRWPEMTCTDKEIDLKITVKEVNGGSGVGRCLLENSFDTIVFALSTMTCSKLIWTFISQVTTSTLDNAISA
jgi:hypothetical protein